MAKVKYCIPGGFMNVRMELSELGWRNGIKMIGDGLLKMLVHSTLPSIFFTFNLMSGIEPAFARWALMGTAALLFHLKEYENERNDVLFSARTLIRLCTLFGTIIVLRPFGMDPTIDAVSSLMSNDEAKIWTVMKAYVFIQLKVIETIGFYRLLLVLFRVTKATSKLKSKACRVNNRGDHVGNVTVCNTGTNRNGTQESSTITNSKVMDDSCQNESLESVSGITIAKPSVPVTLTDNEPEIEEEINEQKLEEDSNHSIITEEPVDFESGVVAYSTEEIHLEYLDAKQDLGEIDEL